MTCKTNLLLAGLAVLAVLSSSQARSISVLQRPGRDLLDTRVQATGSAADFTTIVSSLDLNDPSKQCAFEGYPGSDGSKVQGPLYVVVPKGQTSTVNFALPQDQSLALRSAPTDIAYGTNLKNGLIYARFTAAQTVGYGTTVTAELGNYQQKLCQLTVTFVVGESQVSPPPPPPETPAPTPPVFPQNPCYCSPAANGQSACFNFNQASSDINCFPPSTYKCQQATAAAGQYSIQQGGPILLCNV